MRINMVDIGNVKNTKSNNKERKSDSLNQKKQADFEGVLHNKKNINNNEKCLDANSKLKNIDESFKETELVREQSNQVDINQIEEVISLETDDIKDDALNIEEMLSALFSSNKSQITDVYDLKKSNFDFLKEDNNDTLNEITKVLTSPEIKTDNRDSLIFENTIDIAKLANLEDVSDIDNFLGNFVEKRGYVQDEDIQNLSKIMAVNEEVKGMVVKTLKSKGFTEVDIENLNIKIETIKSNENIGIKKEGFEDNIIQFSNEKELNIEAKTFSNKEFSSNDKSEKEEKILTEIIEKDEISIFDNHLLRVKSFSNVIEKDDISINRFNMKNDIKTAILHMGKTNMKELVVKVNPDNLGEIAIKITSEGDTMKAMLKVTSKETYALLNNQDIKNFLINQDIKVSDVEISLYEDTTFFNGFDGDKENENNEKNQYQDGMHTEFIEFESDIKEEITLSSLDIII
ncbi:MAG: flagellar hook-length control protein FliK [Sarcina sp.]